MDVKRAIAALSMVVTCTLLPCGRAKAAQESARLPEGSSITGRPNIIVILSDDMGFSDLGCYGGEIQTPNLDRLAAGGLRFTQFYNTARCCPTRASLLTGLYPHQAGIGHMTGDDKLEGYRGDLNDRSVTIAEVLRSAGYSTYMAGKWHVTKYAKPDGDKHNWPLQRGFDRFYGTIIGGGSYYDPGTLTRDNAMITPLNDPEYKTPEFYYTNAISDNAAKFIRDHLEKSAAKPFFMYVAYTAAHWPMHALEKDTAKYKGKYDCGYAEVRRRRFERMKDLGLIDRKWDLSPLAGEWDRVENKAWEARCMEVYAAMVDAMDQGIGRIVLELEKGGQLENTLILFLQDNGGCAESMWRTGNHPRPEKPTLEPLGPDALQLVVTPDRSRDGYPMLMGPPELPGPRDTYVTYGKSWANVSNTPFREYKHWVHEGGVSTPLIAHWPKRLRRKGELEHTPGHLIDIMATCVEVAGATYPSEAGGKAIQPMEGRSLLGAFDGKAIARDALYWEHEGNRAIRAGKWKLVARGKKGAWELHDMEADRTEMHDLAARFPDLVKELAAKWEKWAERANVLPLTPWEKEKEK